MKKFKKNSVATVLAVLFTLGLAGLALAAATKVPLGTTDSFAILAGSAISDIAGGSVVVGNVGLSPGGGTAITQLSCTDVTGTIYETNSGYGGGHDSTTGCAVVNSTSLLNTAKSDLVIAYNNARDAATTTVISVDLGGSTLTSGVYGADSTMGLTGTVVLDGQNDPNAVFIFKAGSSLTINADSHVTLINQAQACNVFWQVGSSASLVGAKSDFKGTIMAMASISDASGSTVSGRLLARDGAVTLNGTKVTKPATCATVALSGGVQSVPPVYPLINVTKIPSPLNLPAGPGPVTYTYKVTNIGAVAVSNIEVKDDKCSNVQFVSGDTNKDGLLGLTETWTYNCFKTVSQTETNTVTACGSAANVSSSGTMCDTASATVAVGVPLTPPLIHLVKVPSVFTLPAGGGLVTYQYNITNPGTVPLSDVSISDDKCVAVRLASHAGDVNGNNLLDPGETWHFSCVSNLTQTTTNIGTATGHANGFTITDTSPATVVVAPPGVVVPKLPNTGLPPYGTSTPLDAAIVVGILMAVLASLAVIQKKRKI